MTYNQNTLKIRRATEQDIEGIHLAHMKSIQEVCKKDYTEREILAWGHRPFLPEKRLAAIKNDWVWVAEEMGKVEGFAHMGLIKEGETTIGRIYGLYLSPNLIGRSVGKALMALMMEQLKALQVKTITLDSTLTAQGFYQKLGFVPSGPEKSDVINGVPIRCRPMKYG